MASLHRHPRSPYWHCYYTLPDGSRTSRSTRTAHKGQAITIAQKWQLTADLARSRKLSPDAAREVIARGVSEMFASVHGTALERRTIGEWLDQWLASRAPHIAARSVARYRAVFDRFKTHLGPAQHRDLSALSAADVVDFRDHLTQSLSFNSGRLAVKTLKACFTEAVRLGLITSSPLVQVTAPRAKNRADRRPFTMSELKAVLRAAGSGEWRGIILFGLYTGQRLADVARIRWNQIDTATWELRLTTGKTNRRMVIPIARPLQAYIADLPAADNPTTYIFPAAGAVKTSSMLSAQFYELLVSAGLATPRDPQHGKTAEAPGRAAARPVSDLSFHCLRHTATTWLKAAGASEAVAREIIGHDSATVSAHYTHIDTDTLRRAVNKLPRL